MTDFSVTEPGIYSKVPENDYHQRRFGPSESISATEAKTLLKAPALMMHKRMNPPAKKKEFNFGHVVHALVLGEGLPVHVHQHPNLKSKAAKEEAAEYEALGYVVVSESEYQQMAACADAVRAHPLAGSIFGSGKAEQSMFCQDEQTGVWLRGRIDWVTETTSGETLLVDLKTSRSALPAEFTRHAASLNYAVQMEWYRHMWQQLTGEREPRFLHIVVEKEAPYLVSVCEMNADFQDIGKVKMRQAIDTYKRCLDTGEWPGIPPIVHPLLPPAYYMAELLDLESEIEI